MIVLYIILGVILFLLLLLCIPVRVDIAYGEEFRLVLRYLFFSFPIAPSEKAEEQEKPEEEEKKEEKEKGSTLKQIKGILKETGFRGFLNAIFNIIKLVLNTSKNIIRKIKLKRFDLYMCVAGAQNAADGAIQYGRISGAVYSACGVLFDLVPCKKKAVTVDLDYSAQENIVDFSGRISMRPITLIREGLSLLIKLLPYFKLFLRSRAKTDNKPSERKVTENE